MEILFKEYANSYDELKTNIIDYDGCVLIRHQYGCVLIGIDINVKIDIRVKKNKIKIKRYIDKRNINNKVLKFIEPIISEIVGIEQKYCTYCGKFKSTDKFRLYGKFPKLYHYCRKCERNRNKKFYNNRKNIKLSITELKRIFSYIDGDLVYNINYGKYNPGDIAGTIKGDYVGISINGVQYYAHHLVWMYFNGYIPKGIDIDHINGNKRDNCIENLQLVTRSQNVMAALDKSNNKTGVIGVSFNGSSYISKIKYDGKDYYLGSFDNLYDAAKARMEAELKFCPIKITSAMRYVLSHDK